MKRIVGMSLIALLVAGCASKTEYGTCVGVLDEKKPNLQYKASAWNIAIGVIFFETVIVPALVVLTQLECPVGQK